jgi:hypothetical protein
MGFSLDIAKHTRSNFIKLMDGLSIEQLNIIPEGYTNNIAWNFAHIVAAQQVLCYVRGNVASRIPIDKVVKYQKGSAPEGFIGQEELDYYKEQAFALLDKLKADVSANLFTRYEKVTTAFGVTLNNIHEAIAYFVTHDNLHLGYAQALRRAVLNSEKEMANAQF